VRWFKGLKKDSEELLVNGAVKKERNTTKERTSSKLKYLQSHKTTLQ
jgi:hypothetical protein